MTPGVYLETTVVSYLAARPSRDLVVAAHQQITAAWWATRRSRFRLFVSELVLDEASRGDPVQARERLGLLGGVPSLQLKPEARELARQLLRSGALPQEAAADAIHIAVAAANGIEYLLTWNCRHIANAETRGRIVEACRSLGWESPVLCTPEELMGGDDHD